MTPRHIARSLAGTLLPVFAAAVPAQVSFKVNYLDTKYGGNGRPGWVQAGDMDGDGDLDVVSGGGYALFVYENLGGAKTWKRHGTLDSTSQMGANAGVLYDVDEDGDLDVLSGKYTKELGWWENPGGTLKTSGWKFHRFHPGVTAWFLHDMILVDIDQDGKAAEIVINLHLNTYWNAPVQIYWLRISKKSGDWATYTIQPQRAGANHCHAGFGVGDIDGDGNVDLSYSDGWYEAPNDPTGKWIWHRIVDDVYGVSNSQIGDIDGNGKPDLVVSAGHHGKGVFWLEATDLQKGTWSEHTIDASVIHPEGLQVFDADGDGDEDVIASELFFGENNEPKWTDQKHNLYLYENLGGTPLAWKKHNLAPNTYPNHLPYLVDLNGDKKLDLISESTGAPIVTYLENTTPTPGLRLDRVTPDRFKIMIDDSVRLFGAGFSAATGLRLGSTRILSKDPAHWTRGYYRIVSDTEIEFFPPHNSPMLTSPELRVETAKGTSSTLPFFMIRPAAPLVRSLADQTAGNAQEVLVHGPGDHAMSYLVFSLTKQPLVIPGIVSLGIGGGQPLSYHGAFAHDPQGMYEFGPYLTTSNLSGLAIHVQAAVWDADHPVLPLRATNIWTTKYH